MSTRGSNKRLAPLLLNCAFCAIGSAAHAQGTQSGPPQPVTGLLVGNLCIDGIPLTAKQVRAQFSVNAAQIVEEFDIRYVAASGGSRPVVRLFRAPPESENLLARCSDLAGDVLLEGEVKRLDITRARQLLPGGGLGLIEIPAGALDLELTRTRSSLTPLYGGNLQLGAEGGVSPSGRAWIRNPSALRAETGRPTQGLLDVESWGRRLRGAKVMLPGSGTAVPIDFSAGDSNVIIRLQADGGGTELRQGSFIARDVPIRSDRMELPGAFLEDVTGRLRSVRLDADRTGVKLRLLGMEYSAAQTRFSTPKSEIKAAAATGSIEALVGDTPRSGADLRPAPFDLANQVSEGQACSYALGAAELTRADRCKLTIAASNAVARNWVYSAARPTALPASHTLPSGASIRLASSLESGAETISGEIDGAKLRLGALNFDAERVRLQSADLSGEIRIPFDVVVPPATGNWRIALPDGAVAVEGRLERLTAKGELRVVPARPRDWTVHLAENDLSFAGRVSAVHRAHLWGGTPTFGSLALRFNADTAITIAGTGAVGTLGAAADALTLQDPTLVIGLGASGMILRGPTRFIGSVEIDYDLANGRAAIDRGELDLQNITLATRPGAAGDIGDVRLTDGQASAERLTARLAGGRGQFSATGFRLTAASVESRPNASGGKISEQISWRGEPVRPVTFAQISGSVVPQGPFGELQVVDPSLTGLEVAVRNAQLGTGNALRLTAERAELIVDKLSDAEIRGRISATGGSLAAQSSGSSANFRVESFDLNLLGGTPLAPIGNGRLISTALDLNLRQDLEIKEKCDGGNPYKSLPIRSHITAPAVAMNLELSGGRLSGNGTALLTSAEMRHAGSYSCKATVIKWPIVKEKLARYKYPCPTSRKPFRMCKGWTVIVPEVKIEFDRVLNIRQLYADGFFTAVNFTIAASPSGQTEISSCARLGRFNPLIDMNYVITPRTGISVVNDVLREIADFTSRPFESLLFTALGNVAGTLMPNIGRGLCA